jgi:hypothetical protein
MPELDKTKPVSLEELKLARLNFFLTRHQPPEVEVRLSRVHLACRSVFLCSL